MVFWMVHMFKLIVKMSLANFLQKTTLTFSARHTYFLECFCHRYSALHSWVTLLCGDALCLLLDQNYFGAKYDICAYFCKKKQKKGNTGNSGMLSVKMGGSREGIKILTINNTFLYSFDLWTILTCYLSKIKLNQKN